MQRPDWVPADITTDTPSPARMYDALLGGSHNFEVDRVAADQAVALVPDLPKVAMSNRTFLRRAVRHLVDAGIRQFLDIGAGIPTVGNTHEAAQLGAHAARRTGVPIIFRSREQITAFFDGFTVIESGIVGLHRWRPETPGDTAEISGPALGLAGVGRKDQR